MVIQYNLFSLTGTPDSEDSEAGSSNLSDSFSDGTKLVTFDDVVLCLTKSGLRYPLYADQTIDSLIKIGKRGHTRGIVSAVVKHLEDSSHSFKRSHRIAVYAALARVVGVAPFDPATVDLDPASLKSFIIRMISDIDKSATVEADSTVRSFSRLISHLCMISFRDLAVGVLLTPELVLGRPTVASVVVADALINLFTDMVKKQDFSDSLHAIFGKLETVPSMRSNNLLISAVIRGLHRVSIEPSVLASIGPSIRALYESTVDGQFTPESIETALLLLSCLETPDVSHLEELRSSITLVGTKGLENEDCRDQFGEMMKILWSRKISLFSDSQTEELMNLLLLSDIPSVWADGPPSTTVPFLKERFLLKSSELKPLVLSAISAITLASKETVTDPIIVSLVDQHMMSEDVKMSPQCVVLILKLLEGMNPVTPFMVGYVEKFLCAPASAVSVRFPKGILDSDLERIRVQAKQTLLTFASSRDLVNHLLENLEHMPSVGLDAVCEAISIQKTRKILSLPQSQSFIVLVWLLISIDLNVENVESVIACLVSIAPILHPSLDGIWERTPESSLVDLKDHIRSFGDEIFSVFHALEFPSRDLKNRFFHVSLETLIVLLPTCVPQVRSRLIIVWEHIMNIVVPDQSISAFTSRLVEFLNLSEAITASPECIEASARAIGRLADRRFDAVLETVWRTWKNSGTESSISNSIRIKKNKSSLRGFFTTEKSELAIRAQIRVRQIALRAIGQAVGACPVNRLSDLRSKECLEELLLKTLKSDSENLKEWLQLKPSKEDELNVESTVAVIESITEAARAISVANLESIDSDFFKKFQQECIDIIISLLDICCIDLPSFPMEPLFLAIAALVDIRHLEISSDKFGDVLETTLECLVHSVPDNPGALNAVSEEAVKLASRCQSSAQVVKSLLGHANSWLGFTRLVKAVFALGGNGPLPLVRWVCVRIIREIADDTDIVRSDSDITEFLEVVATLIPRIADSYPPVAAIATELLRELLLRCQFTKDISSNFSASIVHAIPGAFVSGYVLNLIGNIHDSDAAGATVDAIFTVLSVRSCVFSSEDSAAEAVVDAILSNAAMSVTDSPIPSSLSRETRIRLVTSLRFIAAVRFPIAIKEILKRQSGGDEFSEDKVHALHALVRDKTTLAYLTNELMERINHVDSDAGFVAAVALGHMLDCFEDTGVASIASKYFCDMFLSLLVLMWRYEGGKATIRLVVHKLCRAAAVGRLPDSLSTESGLTLLGEKIDRFRCMQFLRPILVLETSSKQRQAAVMLAAQLVGVSRDVDLELWMILSRVAEQEGHQIEVSFAMKGLSGILRRKCNENDFSDVERIVTLFTSNVSSFDAGISLESLVGLGLVAKACPEHLVQILMKQSVTQIRRVVDHSNVQVRCEAFRTLTEICRAVGERTSLESDEDHVSAFFSAVADLWIPCFVRSWDEADVREEAFRAFETIINVAVADEPVGIPRDRSIEALIDVVRTEIGECSVNHLNSCAYYLLGLPNVNADVAITAAKLAPLLIALVKEPSSEAAVVVSDMVEKMLVLSQSIKGVNLLIANVITQGKRMEIAKHVAHSS